MHSSFKNHAFNVNPTTATSKIIPYGNGFVDGLLRAFQQDLHLVIRPDDVWLAITTQFSFYVNQRAEKLRSTFVSHQGQKTLSLEFLEPPEAYEVPSIARKFTCLMQEHLKDGEIRDWLIPDFTTTTDNDVAVGSMVMMATMKKYFSYECMTMCGFPSVTLLGEKADWEKILARIDLLDKYGDECARWAELLRPVLRRFVDMFREPEAEDMKAFWDKACHVEYHYGSGRNHTYTGWLTAFMMWSAEGRVLGKDWERREDVYVLDGQRYPEVEKCKVPIGVVEVPVVIKDLSRRVKIDTTIVAGSVGVSVVRKGDEGVKGEDVMQPVAGWWMFEDGRSALED
ncbi:hypothetical protein K458DRAFT_319247 [Lentithecium fluviatile CBS 122367]|uniref:DUF4419 domain-containing protein n=1 Tax=Lentithecium fluviatile CBS 122367 TaxID=1168545 RepID=A0A6G1IHT9_9PLEO|nr:hypothetical protein K458DRAFT_319247 [Lentithecium fluviatile CBS 122367]